MLSSIVLAIIVTPQQILGGETLVMYAFIHGPALSLYSVTRTTFSLKL